MNTENLLSHPSTAEATQTRVALQMTALMTEHQHKFIVMVDAGGRPHSYVGLEATRGRAGTVAENSARLPATVCIDDDLRTAVSMMFMHDMRWLACVDREGLFAGFVTQQGITRLLGVTYQDAAKKAF